MKTTADTDRAMLERALELARISLDHGSGPVGCVIVDERGEVIAEGRNRAHEPWPLESREIAGSSLAHAELSALFHLQDLEDAPGWTLYSSLEPCLMCSGALALLGLGRVVWACDDPWNGAGRGAPWGSQPAFAQLGVVAHPYPDLEAAAAELFAPEALSSYPPEGWARWRARYPAACAGAEAVR